MESCTEGSSIAFTIFFIHGQFFFLFFRFSFFVIIRIERKKKIVMVGDLDVNCSTR